MKQVVGGAKTQPITPTSLDRHKPCLGDQDKSTVHHIKSAPNELLPFLGGDSVGCESKDAEDVAQGKELRLIPVSEILVPPQQLIEVFQSSLN